MAELTKLVRYSEEKLDKLKQIEQFTKRQKAAIDSHDLAVLAPIVEEKQKVIDYIDWCDDAFQDELQKLKERFGVKTLKDIGEIDDGKEGKTLVGIIAKIVETIESIQLLEKDNHEKLVMAMEQVKEKLKRVRQGQKSVALYDGGVSSASGSFIDKKK
jgi:hypothetical protein